MMKKISIYLILMIAVLIVLPLLIVRGCSTVIEEISGEDIVGQSIEMNVNDKGEEYGKDDGKDTQKDIEGKDLNKENDYPKDQDKFVNDKSSTRKIKVYIENKKKTEEMLLEEYIKGVVAAEIPTEYEMEAIKAQAVAARTYAYGRIDKIYVPEQNNHKDADVCTNSNHCQAWISKEDASLKWGKNFETKWVKIENAVKETEDVILLYEDKIVNPVFHSNSGGYTENAEEVWDGVIVPYLKSTSSKGEEEDEDYKAEVVLKNKDIISRLKNNYPKLEVGEKTLVENIKILNYSAGNRVKSIKVGNVTIKGTEFRSILGLRSTNFKIHKVNDQETKITTIGYGHGVGMSQNGANYLAKEGSNYEDILKHYYSGVSINTIEEAEFIK